MHTLDISKIYASTKIINDLIHHTFKLKIYNHRIIFTGCLLIAEQQLMKENASFNLTDDTETLKTKTVQILQNLKEKSYNHLDANQLQSFIKRIDNLITIFNSIVLQTNNINNDIATKTLIEKIKIIANELYYADFNGEDILHIFFNEFNRYNKKSTLGQVFTPLHIASFMYKLLDCSANDRILDATCGSGTFLMKSLDFMLKETGYDKNKIDDIKTNHLFGNEIDSEIVSLCFINSLLHDDLWINLANYDANSKEFSQWAETKNITRVLMNPPYEQNSNPLNIVNNTLNSVLKDAICGFVLPCTIFTLSSNETKISEILKNHTMTAIIELPDTTFNLARSKEKVSIFIFKAKIPHNKQKILTCKITKDGLKTIKNQGRQDVNNIWKDELEPYWLNEIKYEHKKCVYINYNDPLMYKDNNQKTILYKEDIVKNVFKYECYKNNIDLSTNKFNEMIDLVLSIKTNKETNKLIDNFKINKHLENVSNWQEFKITDLFTIASTKPSKPTEIPRANNGAFDYVSTKTYNNGLVYKTNIKTEEGNVLTFVSAATGFFTYRPIGFIASDHVEKLVPKIKFNEDIALFIVAVWNSTKSANYDYKFKLTHKNIAKETILLPVKNKEKGNDLDNIDFDFMADYIKDIKEKWM